MRLLLDTHALLWWFSDDPALSAKARQAIGSEGNQVFVSTASAWELAIKTRSGKLDAQALLDHFEGYLARHRFETLSIRPRDAIAAALLAGKHKDPFDRVLAAQAQGENLAIVSRDRVFGAYGVRRIW